jgi:drug/metabolite transporter (DMT)-like permease
VTAGAGFGGFFVLLERVPDGSGIWSIVGARTGSLVLVLLALTIRRRAVLAPPPVRWQVLAAGLGDTTANVLYLLAVQRGLLSLVAVLTSLYPASTLLLARAVLGERVGPVQRAGLGVAGVAVGLVALG